MTDSAAELLLSKRQVTLECKNIFYRPRSKKIKSDILSDVSAKFQFGRLTAVLGPSGAGKTSFLNILSGFKTTGLRGTILVNGMERNRREFRKFSSYIPQEFAMLDKLTVLETLTSAADLKLGLRTKYNLKHKVIKEIIELLNLEKCSNTFVGKLSGGEKKRLSVGVELVTNPPIMLFDEPTSGLDSVSSLQVLSHLQKLAHCGRTIICSIHQPSSRLLKLFDDVLVLSEGQCIYNGTQEDMVSVFKSRGYICPNYYNPADFAMEVASREHGSDLSALISANQQTCGNDIMLKDIKSNNGSNHIMNGVQIGLTTDFKDDNGYFEFYPATFWEQFAIIMKRSLKCMMRDMINIQLRFVVHIIVGFLLGVVFWDVGNDASKILSNNSCLFFIIMFIFLANAMPSILPCPLETDVFIREHLNNWYSVPAYYLSKLAADLPLQLICPTLFGIISYYLTGQPCELDRYLMFGGICILTGMLGQSFGLFGGSAFSMNMAVFIVPASTIPMLIFSGFFIRFNELSEYLRPISHISYFRYSFEGLVQVVYGFNRTKLECQSSFCYYKSPTKFLQDIDMYGDRYTGDVTALIVWFILLQIAFYLSLLINVKRAQ